MRLPDNTISLISFTGYENTVIDEDPIAGRKKSSTLWNHKVHVVA